MAAVYDFVSFQAFIIGWLLHMTMGMVSDELAVFASTHDLSANSIKHAKLTNSILSDMVLYARVRLRICTVGAKG